MLIGKFWDALPLLGHFQNGRHKKKYEKLKMRYSIPQLLNITDTQTLYLNICFWGCKIWSNYSKIVFDHLRAQNLILLPILAQITSSTSNDHVFRVVSKRFPDKILTHIHLEGRVIKMCSSGLAYILVLFDNFLLFEIFSKYIKYLLTNGA